VTKNYRVTISDQTDDEGEEIHYYIVGAVDIFVAMDRVAERYHDMVQTKKITIVEAQA
jgi:hypothetical protein